MKIRSFNQSIPKNPARNLLCFFFLCPCLFVCFGLVIRVLMRTGGLEVTMSGAGLVVGFGLAGTAPWVVSKCDGSPHFVFCWISL
jgi:hypothetical protein